MDNSADTRGEEAVKHAAVLASISAVHERQNSPIRERQPALAERVVLMSGEEPDEALVLPAFGSIRVRPRDAVEI